MSAKLPVVFLPGLLCNGALWQHQITAFSDQIEAQVADLTQYNNIQAMAESVLQRAPRQFALSALSMGGYVAFEMMRQAPERLLKLCLFDTSARPDTPEQQQRRRLLLQLSKSGKFKGVTPRLLPMLVHPDHLKDEHITGTIMRMAEEVGREAFQNQQTAILGRIDSRPYLAAIKCPVTIIGGQQDEVTPPKIVQEIADHIPQAQLHLIEKCGHLAPLEQPQQVNPLFAAWLSAN